MELNDCLKKMREIYKNDPSKAVRGQAFINLLHAYLVDQLRSRISKEGRKRGLEVRTEPTILGSHKPKDVDVAVIDPDNGPLLLVGVRSQMSSVGNNALTYYEGIIGECISLQERFPMAVHGYVYLMPVSPIKPGKEAEKIDHRRYSRMYAAIHGRSGQDYKSIRGIYDQFAYMVVDFGANPPKIRDDLFTSALPGVDISIRTFVERMVGTFKARELFLDYFT